MSDSAAETYGVPKVRSSEIRVLANDEVLNMIKQDTRLVAPFAAAKFEENAQKHWDQFYKRNTTKFFKDRHWTIFEFKEFLSPACSLDGKSVLEVGCGVGNLLFPLLETCPGLKIFACDFSKRAVEFVTAHEHYDPKRVTVFQADITNSSLKAGLKCQVDIITMVFVLSAVHPSKFLTCFNNIFDCLKAGGILLFRDYAVNDMTQVRFKAGHKISNNFYVRQDGTRTYFFSIETLREVALAAGFEEMECYYVYSRTINKKENVDVPRVFLQAKLSKPV